MHYDKQIYRYICVYMYINMCVYIYICMGVRPVRYIYILYAYIFTVCSTRVLSEIPQIP